MNIKDFKLYDMHMHTRFSGDSEDDPFAMAQHAYDIGLAGICFTDHLDIDYSRTPGLFDLDIPAYKKEIVLVKENFRDKLDVCWGVELGLQPHIVAQNKAVATENDFDFIIGSTHQLHRKDIYFPDFYEGKNEDDCYRDYFEETLVNAQSDADFDVYGHIDYVVRYGPNKNQFYSYEKFADIIDEILRTLISRGRGIELNMAGFKYGLGHPNPTESILKRYKELGGEIITIGSDGHTPEQMAWEFEKAPAILKEAGFECFTTFRKRQPEFHKIL